MVLLALLLVEDQTRALQRLDWVVGDAAANVALVFGFWTGMLAPGFYLCALWSLGMFLSVDRDGAAFGLAMVKSVRETGRYLLIGAACGLLVHPLGAVWLMGRELVVDLPEQIEDLTIGLVGIGLYLLAAAGGRMRDELEQFV